MEFQHLAVNHHQQWYKFFAALNLKSLSWQFFFSVRIQNRFEAFKRNFQKLSKLWQIKTLKWTWYRWSKPSEKFEKHYYLKLTIWKAHLLTIRIILRYIITSKVATRLVSDLQLIWHFMKTPLVDLMSEMGSFVFLPEAAVKL